MPKGSYFPYEDFGFLIPSTLGDDVVIPLDVLVFMDDPVPVGCALTPGMCWLIGAIEAKLTRENGAGVIGNAMTALLAVATHAHTHAHIGGVGR